MPDKKKARKDIIRGYVIFAATLIAAGIILWLFPNKVTAATTTTWNYFLEMIMILPGGNGLKVSQTNRRMAQFPTVASNFPR
jgi:hypothetical protein